LVTDTDIQSATAGIRRRKRRRNWRRRRRKETTGQKYNGLPYSIGRPDRCHTCDFVARLWRATLTRVKVA